MYFIKEHHFYKQLNIRSKWKENKTHYLSLFLFESRLTSHKINNFFWSHEISWTAHTGTYIMTKKSFKFTTVSWTHSLRRENECISLFCLSRAFSLQAQFFLTSIFFPSRIFNSLACFSAFWFDWLLCSQHSWQELGKKLDFNTTSLAWGSFTVSATRKWWHFLQDFCCEMVTVCWRIMNVSHFIFSSFNTCRLRNVHHFVEGCYH